jgi:hypothetical protein
MRQIQAILITMAGILLVLVPAMRADSLQLKSGNFVQGKYLGGTDRAVQFEVNGKIRLYGVDEILSISFAAASADGGLPSNNVDPKASSDTGLDRAGENRPGLRAALWDRKRAPILSGRQVAWEQRQYSSGAELRAGGPAGPARSSRTAVAANSDAKKRACEIPARSVCVPPRRFPVLVN